MRLHSFWAGFFSGLRSGTPLALTARAANMGDLKLPGPLALLASDRAAQLLRLASSFEFVADKLPFAPSRLEHSGLAARVLAGSVTGAGLSAGSKSSLAQGAALGAAGALAGSVLGYQARTRLVDALDAQPRAHLGPLAPHTYIAFVEDAIALAGSAWVIKRASRANEEDALSSVMSH
jgi:uncharacterized membrane protein